MVEALKLQFIGLLSDGRSGLCVTLILLPPQELVGTFPRGEGKIFMFFVIPKLICISMFLALGERGTYYESLPL